MEYQKKWTLTDLLRLAALLLSMAAAWVCFKLHTPLSSERIPLMLLIAAGLAATAWKPFLSQVKMTLTGCLEGLCAAALFGYKIYTDLQGNGSGVQIWIMKFFLLAAASYCFCLFFSSLHKLLYLSDGTIEQWIRIQKEKYTPVSGKYIWLIILGGIITITLCSLSSFLYKANPAPDPNYFFTLGKSWANGLIPFRDVYEQKGPLLFLIHSLAYLISQKSFFGVYLMETLFVGCFLILAVKTVNLCIPVKKVYFAFLPLIALMFTAYCFRYGDNAEEICLPFLMVPLYYHTGVLMQKRHWDFRCSFLTGVAAGVVFWIKYTMVGIYIGWFIAFSVFLFRKHNFREWWKTIGGVAAGVLAVSLTIVVYFFINKSLSALFEAYFYNNLFLYTVESGENGLTSKIINTFMNLYTFCIENPMLLFSLSASFLTMRRLSSKLFWEWLSSFAFLAVLTFAGRPAYPYYSSSFVLFTVFSVIPAAAFIKLLKIGNRTIRSGILASCSFLVMIGVDLTVSMNIPVMKLQRNQFSQLVFSDVISQVDQPDMIYNGMMDRGYLTPGNTLPSIKYYCLWSVDIEEKFTEPLKAISEKIPKFILTNSVENWDGYQIVAQGKYDVLSTEPVYQVYLYARTDLIPELDLSILPDEYKFEISENYSE